MPKSDAIPSTSVETTVPKAKNLWALSRKTPCVDSTLFVAAVLHPVERSESSEAAAHLP